MDWGFVVGVAGLGVSVATLFFVLLDRAERSRRMRRVAWDFKSTSTVHRVQNAKRNQIAGVVRLANTGASTGRIIGTFLVGATPIDEDNPLPDNTFLSGQVHDFRVEPCDSEQVWLWITYIDADDTRYAHTVWLPASNTGALADDLERQRAKQPSGRRRRRQAIRATGPVGPGGVPQRSWRRSDRRFEESIFEAAATAIDRDGRTITM